MAIAKARNKAREEADRYMPIMASLESAITINALVSLSDTTPVVIVWSFEVVYSISLLSNSVVVVGSFIVTVLVKVELSCVVGVLPVVAVVGRVCTLCSSRSLSVVAFLSSTVRGGDIITFAALVVAGGLTSV